MNGHLNFATDFQIIGSELLIFDQEQRLIRKYDTYMENLENEGHYRVRSNSRRIIDEHYYYLPKIMLRDLNGDDLNEVALLPLAGRFALAGFAAVEFKLNVGFG